MSMDFLSWRVSFQSDEQALRALWTKVCMLNADLSRARSQLQAIATAPRSNFEDSVEYQDWAASQAAKTLADIDTPAASVTRTPGACLGCKKPLGAGHSDDCFFAPFSLKRSV